VVLYLLALGAGPTGVLLALGLSLASGALLNALVGRYGDRFGRRSAMMLFGGLMALSGVLLAFAPSLGVALVGLALGAVSPSGSEVGPFLSLEQSIVAEVAESNRRTRAFALYNLAGSFGAAFGALASLLFTAGAGPQGVSLATVRWAFLLYAVLGVSAILLARSLPSSVELGAGSESAPLPSQSRRRIFELSTLFAVDAFAGGLVVQSYLTLWFVTTFPTSTAFLGGIFFGAGSLSALSFLMAAWLGERFGLLQTMVATHLPSNVLLVLVPLAPSLTLAVALYLGRMALSQMDVPTRQAYLAGIVGRSERTAANSYTNSARNVSQAAGPFVASSFVGVAGLATPFFVGGGLKIAYDLAVLLRFRRVKPDML
jgi:MFS family permease